MPSREVVRDECLYAVILELISRRMLAEVSGTLSDVARSETVVRYCGRPLALSTVHYIEKALQQIRRVLTAVRSSKPKGLQGLSARLLKHLIEHGFSESLYILDLAETVRRLQSGSVPAWLKAIIRGLSELLGEHVAGSVILQFLTDYVRKAGHSAATLLSQDLAGYTGRCGRDRRLHIKINSYVNTEPFRKLFSTCFGGSEDGGEECVSMDGDIGEVADILEKAVESGNVIKASLLADYLRHLTSKLFVRYFADDDLLRSVVTTALAWSAHAYATEVIGERIVREATSCWNLIESGTLGSRCSRLAKELGRKSWRLRVLRKALEDLSRDLGESAGLPLANALRRWACEALDKGYVGIPRIRVYEREGLCRVTVTLRISRPVLCPRVS